MTEGRKDDQEKIRTDLLPVGPIMAIAQVLTFGCKKYSDRNWEKGMKWGRVYGALLRHLFAWWRGEKADPETGFSHLWHAGCCLFFLMEYEETHPELDDRPLIKPIDPTTLTKEEMAENWKKYLSSNALGYWEMRKKYKNRVGGE